LSDPALAGERVFKIAFDQTMGWYCFKIAVSGMGLICFCHFSKAATFDVTVFESKSGKYYT